MHIAKKKATRAINFDGFRREAVEVRGLDHVSNYTIDNYECFWRVITCEAVILYHIGITYSRKIYSLLQFTV